MKVLYNLKEKLSHAWESNICGDAAKCLLDEVFVVFNDLGIKYRDLSEYYLRGKLIKDRYVLDGSIRSIDDSFDCRHLFAYLKFRICEFMEHCRNTEYPAYSNYYCRYNTGIYYKPHESKYEALWVSPNRATR